MENSGACRNQNNKYDDIGGAAVSSLMACQQKCDTTQGCGAVSWRIENCGSCTNCYMTSDMASTTSEASWKCYSKGGIKLLLAYVLYSISKFK